jgi:hypothetical protein
MSSFCANGTRSNSNSTPKSPRATIRACEISRQVSLYFFLFRNSSIHWLVVDLPLSKKWLRQLGLLFPIYGKIKNVPNYQPDSSKFNRIMIRFEEILQHVRRNIWQWRLWTLTSSISNNSSIMWEYDGIWLAAIAGFQASACDFAMMPSMLVSASRAGRLLA